MVKGRARGHSKSFTNISESFIIFALPTAAHKSTKVHELHPPQRLGAVWGSPLGSGHQQHRCTTALMDFRGREKPWLKWGFWITDRRPEVLKFFFNCFDFPLMIQKLVSNLSLGLVGWSRETPLRSPSLAKLSACFYSALCTFYPIP